MSGKSQTRGQAIRRLTLVVVVMAVMSYVSCYWILRDRGLREMSEHQMPGMLYDSAKHVAASRDLSTHHFRARVFAPLNFVDRQFFGGKGPIKGIMWELY